MKRNFPKLGKAKKVLIPIAAVAAAAAIGVGIFAAARNGSGGSTVYVYGIDMVGMTDYWGDSKETSGRVSSDNIQTVMLSDTQQVTGIEVAEGDQVKKGDLLLSYDTTLTELGLEKKRLAVEQLKLQLQEEEDRLTEIRNLQPYTPRTDTDDNGSAAIPEGDNFTYDHYPFYDSTDEVERTWLAQYGYDGKSPDTALICWTKYGSIMDDSLANEMGRFLQRCRYLNAMEEYTAQKAAYDEAYAQWEASQDPDKGEAPTPPTEPQEGDYAVSDYYMVLKATYGDKTLTYNGAYHGMHVYLSSSGFFFVPYDASGFYDYTRPETPDTSTGDDDTNVDQGPFYTLAEIVQMKEDQQKKILDVEYQIKIAEAEYNIAQKEANDGNVYAEVDGKVVSVLTEEEAKANQQPIIKVSGGGGYYITGSINELDREKLEVGSEVTVTDYRNGTSCMGTVQSIGDFPSSSGGYYGDGNPNASAYPFTVFVDESEDLVSGYYVYMQYSLTDSVDGVYLEKAFVRTEGGVSYVYCKGSSGKLEKREVTTGKTVWGSYVQILSGITAEDQIAFPYGKTVKVGAPTETGDYSTLYGD